MTTPTHAGSGDSAGSRCRRDIVGSLSLPDYLLELDEYDVVHLDGVTRGYRLPPGMAPTDRLGDRAIVGVVIIEVGLLHRFVEDAVHRGIGRTFLKCVAGLW
jgi:hypothetical protein